jgi:hypothetical protein
VSLLAQFAYPPGELMNARTETKLSYRHGIGRRLAKHFENYLSTGSTSAKVLQELVDQDGRLHGVLSIVVIRPTDGDVAEQA